MRCSWPWNRRGTKRAPVVLPLVLEEPPEWTDQDSLALAQFLAGPIGVRLRKVLLADLYARALLPGLRTEYAQGVDDGKNLELGRILALGQVPEPGE